MVPVNVTKIVGMLCAAGGCWGFALFAPDFARAADASAWVGDQRAAVRLIAGRAGADGGTVVRRAGVEMKLAPGWKTYWRYPGDAGMPPRFAFDDSENVQSTTVLWPAPLKFSDASGTSIGYKDAVIFPIRVFPRDPAKPVRLRLALDYAICEQICVPAEAKLELVLGTGGFAEALAASEARVPRRAKLGDSDPLSIKRIGREQGPSGPRVTVDVVAPRSARVELFAEGPNHGWALPVPALVGAGESGVRQFAFDLDGLPAGAKADGAVLTLTAVAGDDAIEVSAPLD